MNSNVSGGPPAGVYGPDESAADSLLKTTSKVIKSVRRRVSKALHSKKKEEAALERTRHKFGEGGAEAHHDDWADAK